MKDHVNRFWKEYIIAVAIIIVAGIFMSVDMAGFLRKLTGYAVSTTTATIVIGYSYIFLVVLGPLLLVGMAGYNFYVNRTEHHDARDFEKVQFGSQDHELHHFPHDQFVERFESEKGKKLNSTRIKTNFKQKLREQPAEPAHLLSYPHKMDHLVLKEHIKDKLMQGMAMTEIVEKLKDYNWSEKKINLAFNDIKLANTEAEILLGSFITSSLIKGHNITSIRQALVNKGWENHS